jgi:hypothetical protein
MPIVQMATPPPIEDRAASEPGAPVPRDAIDPELVKLARPRPKIGAITAAAVVVLCGLFMLRLGPDRRFHGEPEAARAVALADVAAGKVADESFVSFEAEPMMSHAVRIKGDRSGCSRASGHLRVTSARGTGERVWLVLPGDAWERPILKAYTGRLRRIGELPFAGVLDAHTTAHPRPTFARAASVRAAFTGGPVTTVAGDPIAVADTDRVAFDVVEPGRATIVATFTGNRDPAEGDPGHGPLTDAALWIAELGKHGVTATVSPTPGQVDAILGQARLDVAMPVADVTGKLEAAKLWAARVERVTRHHETTWGALRASPAGALAAGGGPPVPDEHVDLVGLYVQRGVPGDAYALIVGERPADYWHVLPLTVVLGIIGLLFAWALVRAVRDLMPARDPVTTPR